MAGEKGHGYFECPVKFQKISSATIAYRKFGSSGKPLVFLHGWPLAGVTFRKLIPLLQNDFTCYVPDLPGGGETTWCSRADFSWPGQALSVKQFIDALGLESYFLLGQDSGAMIGRYLALIDNKRVKKFAMTNTEIPCHRPPWIPWARRAMFIPGANAVFRLILRSRWFLRSSLGFGGSFSNLDLIDGEFREHIIQPLVHSSHRMEGHIRFLRGWDWTLLDNMKNEHDYISMPVLLIWGEDDPTFPVEEAERMVGQFKNCLGIERIPGARLFVQEEQPESLSKILLEFMK